MAFNFGAKFVSDSAARTAMISQPMAGRSEKEIRYTRETAANELRKQGYIIKDSYFCDEFKSDIAVHNKPVYFLAKAIRAMADCDAVYFCKGWRDARGCCIEHEIAKRYGLEVMYAENSDDRDSFKEKEQPSNHDDAITLNKKDYEKLTDKALKELAEKNDKNPKINDSTTSNDKDEYMLDFMMKIFSEIAYRNALYKLEEVMFRQ